MDDLSALRRTKIVATFGPASSSPEMIEKLLRAGVDTVRLNFSHGTHEDHKAVYEHVRKVEADLGRPIAVLQDLQGPKIRLGMVEEGVVLQAKERVLLSSQSDFSGDAERLPTTYDRLSIDVRIGERLLIADGTVVLRVVEIIDKDVACEVEVGGPVSSKKGLNMPETRLSVPSLTDKDLSDLTFGLELGVDWVALSFVRTPHDVLVLRGHMERLGKVVPIIAKIEKPQAVERLEPIVEVSEGVMVARGDLGVELPREQVPSVQRRAISLARERGKTTIVATQMLVSMTESALPSHAEVSDVANAVFDGTDAVMLSEETASGKFPVEAVAIMAEIIRAADNGEVPVRNISELVPDLQNSYPGTISSAAVLTAKHIHARAIVAFTDFGLGPRLISAWRPRTPIIGCAATREANRRMALYWGVQPVVIDAPESFEGLVEAVERAAEAVDILEKGSTVVLTTKMPFGAGRRTNVLKLHTIGGET